MVGSFLGAAAAVLFVCLIAYAWDQRKNRERIVELQDELWVTRMNLGLAEGEVEMLIKDVQEQVKRPAEMISRYWKTYTNSRTEITEDGYVQIHYIDLSTHQRVATTDALVNLNGIYQREFINQLCQKLAKAAAKEAHKQIWSKSNGVSLRHRDQRLPRVYGSDPCDRDL